MFVVEGHIIFARRLLLWATKGLSVSSHSLLMTINVSLLAPTGSPISLWATVERNINKMRLTKTCPSTVTASVWTTVTKKFIGSHSPTWVTVTIKLVLRQSSFHYRSLSEEICAMAATFSQLTECQQKIQPSTVSVSLWATVRRQFVLPRSQSHFGLFFQELPIIADGLLLTVANSEKVTANRLTNNKLSCNSRTK